MSLRDLNFGVNSTDTGSLPPNVHLRAGQYLPQSFETDARKFTYYFHPFRGTIPSLPTNINFMQYFLITLLILF